MQVLIEIINDMIFIKRIYLFEYFFNTTPEFFRSKYSRLRANLGYAFDFLIFYYLSRHNCITFLIYDNNNCRFVVLFPSLVNTFGLFETTRPFITNLLIYITNIKLLWSQNVYKYNISSPISIQGRLH